MFEYPSEPTYSWCEVCGAENVECKHSQASIDIPTWFELQVDCYECAGHSVPYSDIDELAHAVAIEDFYNFKPIRVKTLVNRIPETIYFIGLHICAINEFEDYEYLKLDPLIAYTYTDDFGNDKVIFIFNKEKGA